LRAFRPWHGGQQHPARMLRGYPSQFCSGPVHKNRAQPADLAVYPVKTVYPVKFGHESPRKRHSRPIAANEAFPPDVAGPLSLMAMAERKGSFTHLRGVAPPPGIITTSGRDYASRDDAITRFGPVGFMSSDPLAVIPLSSSSSSLSEANSAQTVVPAPSGPV
jgi:hypothetical protein